MQQKSKVDAILTRQKEEKQRQEKMISDLKIACKELFSNNNGTFFLQYLKTLCLWAEQDNNINNEILIYKKGRRDIWAIIRNILPPNILAQIEIYDAGKIEY
jgi:hypothetical protein